VSIRCGRPRDGQGEAASVGRGLVSRESQGRDFSESGGSFSTRTPAAVNIGRLSASSALSFMKDTGSIFFLSDSTWRED
jgi:hypothetical protein